MPEITHRTVQSNGMNIHIAEAGSGPLVLLIHGFPELWYSWRHQLPALADAGYHAVAPDVRGYGRSDAPHPIEAYSMRELTADAVGIVDALGERTAVIAGHDWGAPIAANSAMLYPDRFRAVAALSVPFLARSPAPPTQLFKQIFQDNFFYMLYFQEPGVAEAEFEADIPWSVRTFLYSASGDAPRGAGLGQNKKKGARFFDGLPQPDKLPGWLTEDDIAYYAGEFQRTGYRGGLNRYRNMDRDWEELSQLQGAQVKQPALFIAGKLDPVLTFARVEGMKDVAPDLRDTVLIEGCGHWVQQERPDEVNAALIKFLKELPADGAAK